MLIGLLSVASLCYIPWVIAIASSKYLNTLTLAFFFKTEGCFVTKKSSGVFGIWFNQKNWLNKKEKRAHKS